MSYATDGLDTAWIPDGVPLVVVHNDDSLDPHAVAHAEVVHLRAPGNVGFGAGVNLAVDHLTTERMIVVNPDAHLTEEHWRALSDGAPHEVVTIPTVAPSGAPSDPLQPHPGPLGLLLGGWRLGRIAPLGSRRRRLIDQVLRPSHRPVTTTHRRDSLRTHWVSGAVFAIDTARYRSIGGFDDAYFLYYEDVDLSIRLGERYPDMEGVVVPTVPAGHDAGSAGGASSAGERRRLESAILFSSRQAGWRWRVVQGALVLRGRWRR